MRRLLIVLIMIVFTVVDAQTITQSQAGDPPIATLISVSLPDANGIVTITGAAGAVFPNAQVAIRNLYTEQIVYTNAGITGAFNQRIYGPGTTPFWVSAAANFPQELRDVPGSLPGGPGTIVYGSSPEVAVPPDQFTNLIMDGDLTDWESYPDAGYALYNQNSFYVGLNSRELTSEVTQIQVVMEVDGAEYTTTIARDQLRRATTRQTAPRDRNRGEFAINAAVQDTVFEARLPLEIVDSPFQSAALKSIVLDDETITIDQPFLPTIQRDGALYPQGRMESPAATFYVAGAVAQGASYWTASARINTLSITPRQPLIIEMDVNLFAPELPLTIADIIFGGEIGLQPVSVPALNAANGWSNMLTPSGLAIENIRGDLALTSTEVEWNAVTRYTDHFLFGLRFEAEIPANLPDGIYVPYFTGIVRDASNSARWTDNGFFGRGDGISRLPLTRLPVTLNAGEVTQRLYWTLFQDHPSEGSRGLLAQEDQGAVAISSRVRFNSSTYILPPGNYPVEPYIPNLMPNAYATSSTPLVPFLFPGGRLTAAVVRPDGTNDNLSSAAIVQNRLSTSELDERARFGAQNPVDMYRLTTLNPLFTAYNFSDYGAYTITLTGSLNDTNGRSYEGGGTYNLLVAERFDVTTGVLSGTPFEVGDHFYPGLRLLPALPAEVIVTVRVYPLDGSATIEETFSGTANEHGYFAPPDSFTFETPGEYVIDYEARYTDVNNKLWAGSVRSAGLIATPDSPLVARGQRGLYGLNPQNDSLPRPAWFTTRQYPGDGTAVDPVLYTPYHSGDVAVVLDSPTSGIYPVIQVQDLSGDYAGWLRSTIPNYQTPYGETLEETIREDAIPLFTVLGGPPDSPYQPALLPELMVSQAYGYISAVRPGVTVRQFVQGQVDTALLFGWDGDDPLNRQMGAGTLGVRPGDYTFLFGGAVVRNVEAGLQDAAIYAALAVTGTREGDALGARVFPPFRGEAGGADGGTLITVRDVSYDAFFHPTAIQPGQVLNEGDLLVIAGQAAPTLQTRVDVRVTAPDGTRRDFSGLTNSIGYFYQPEHNFSVDQVGRWQVRILTTPVSATSSGGLEPPLPQGQVLGATESTYLVYVTTPETEALVWNRGGDIDSQTPAGGLFNFTLDIPAGWTNVSAYHTVTTPGYILEEGILRTTSTAAYQYSPPELTRIFPNLEFEGRGAGAAASDVVNITFAVSGTDEAGSPRLSTRTFTIMHDRILSFEGE